MLHLLSFFLQVFSSPLISHLSSLISHLSSLISHISYLISHLSSLISHLSSLISRLSSLISHLSSLITSSTLPPPSLLSKAILCPFLQYYLSSLQQFIYPFLILQTTLPLLSSLDFHVLITPILLSSSLLYHIFIYTS